MKRGIKMTNTKIEKTFKGLPEKSFFKHNITGETIIIKRGERGYYEQNEEIKHRDADELNARFKVTKAQAVAMFVGSMFGWNAPAANPAIYDENGEMIDDDEIIELEEVEDNGLKECPVCKKKKMNEDEVMNSLSRKDNKTMICNDCGMQEAFDDM